VARLDITMLLAAAAMLVSACGVSLRVTRPKAVEEQARRSAAIVARETTRSAVHAALGAPWLASREWNIEAFRADAEQREIGFIVLFTPPIPIAAPREHVTGFVLVSYAPDDVVAEVRAGSAPSGDPRGVLLRVGAVSLGIEGVEPRGAQLFAEASAWPQWLAARRASHACTLLLACEPSARDRWLDESCPDRASVDGAEALDLRGYLVACDGGNCPEGAREGGSFARIPLAVPVSLAPGSHVLALASSTYLGRSEQAFSCAAGNVRFALVRGDVKRHWWGPSKSTLEARAEISDAPDSLGARRILLYRGARWLMEPEPAP